MMEHQPDESLRQSSIKKPLVPRHRQGASFLHFIFISLSFVGSAAFMWNQPTDISEGIVFNSHPIDYKRLDTITAEMTRRVNMPPRPIAYRSRKSAMVAITQPSVTPVKAISLSIGTERHPQLKQREQLEAKVLKILKKYGKPSAQGKELSAAIVREALAQDYDPMFVAAVIKSESAFNSHARSHKGAQGLMQIMPRTGAWLAHKAAIPHKKLTDTEHNLRLGISYLKQLESEYKGDRVLALMAYNWGPGRVASASHGGRKVPGQVVQYAVKILNDYRRWSSDIG